MSWIADIFRLGALCTIASALLAGCDKGAAPEPETVGREPVHIVGTVYATADLAQQIGGKYVETSWAVESGQPLADFQPPSDVRDRLTRADLILAGGSGSEPWAVSGSGNVFLSQRIVRFDTFAGQADSPTEGLPWLDPALAKLMADELASRLATLRPERETYFRYNAQQFKETLDAILKDYPPRFEKISRLRVLALSHEFDPLLKRFGIDVTHALESVKFPLEQWQMNRLREVMVHEHVKLLIVRSDSPAGLMQELSSRVEIIPLPLDPYGRGDAAGRKTYQELIRYDLDQLLEALSKSQ